MVHERREVRIVDLDRHVGDVCHGRRQQFEQAQVGRVVALHRADLDDAAGTRRGVGDVVAIVDRERQRLLAEDVQAGSEPGQRDVAVEGVGGRADQRVQPQREQRLDRVVQLGDAVALAERGADGRGGVGECDELEALALLPEVERVLGLTDQARSHEPDPQPCRAAMLPLLRRLRPTRR